MRSDIGQQPSGPDRDAPPAPVAFGRSRELSRSVSAELDQIFSEAVTSPADPPPRGRAASRVRTILAGSHRPRAGRVATLGALCAAALAGVSFGSVLVKYPAFQPAPTAAAAAPARQTISIAKADIPDAPAAPAAGPSLPWPTPAFEATTPQGQAGQPPAVRPPLREIRPRLAPRKAVARSQGWKCERLRGGALARCAYPTVIAADRRLRNAYASATRAGVSRSVLVSYRTAWADLRPRASWDPGHVIDGYDTLTRDLTRMAQQHRARRASERS
ncbi:MAG: hypothetical protein JWQ46_1902 [Phenylobacterium sp.]|nr:hypothetical protein [Phenylobacterium sp.]